MIPINRYYIAFWTLVILAIIPALSLATSEGGGGPWAFTTIGVGARAIGMGGAFVAIADDATAPYWNPAGLGILSKKELSITSIIPSSEMAGNHYYLSLCYPTSYGTPGISLNHFKISGIQITNYDDIFSDQISGERLSDTEFALNLSYGLAIPNPLNRDMSNVLLGANARAMHQNLIDEFSYTGLGWDIGFIIKAKKDETFYGLLNPRVGYMLRYNADRTWENLEEANIDKDKKITEPESISWYLGTAFDARKNMTFALSLLETDKRSPIMLSMGVELKLINGMAIRAGINDWKIIQINASNTNWEKSGFPHCKIACGIGISYIPFMQIDYAVIYDELYTKHQISVICKY
jgi:hypothetical protein